MAAKAANRTIRHNSNGPDWDRFRGCLLGLAIGDALGAPLESLPRGSFPPVTDLVPPRPGLPLGGWTDDTATALCVAASLKERCRFAPQDIMRRLLRWWREGYMSCTGHCYGIGGTTQRALEHFLETGRPPSEGDQPFPSNGCIMRLAPVPMFSFPDEDHAERLAVELTCLTHPLQECLDAARLLAKIICRALTANSKDAILLDEPDRYRSSPRIAAIAAGEYHRKSPDEIRGSLYVADCLEAALWCFHRAENFRDAVLLAVNLGEDTDTTAAVCGQVAGAFWGAGGIPCEWLEHLAWRAKIESMAERLAELADQRIGHSYQPGTDHPP